MDGGEPLDEFDISSKYSLNKIELQYFAEITLLMCNSTLPALVDQCLSGPRRRAPLGGRELGINFTMEYNLISLAGRAISFKKLFAGPVAGGGGIRLHGALFPEPTSPLTGREV